MKKNKNNDENILVKMFISLHISTILYMIL